MLSQQERWDVAVKVLNGPQASLGEQVLRGPVVRLGADPGPGGLKLGGYRGLDARQCVITAYTGGTAAIAPVGNNQVRIAPHPNVVWEDIDPVTGPVHLSPGCALHLGPLGRGATIQFVACRRLGEWQQGVLASEREDQPDRPPAIESFDARRVGRIRSSNVPVWFFGCTFLMASTTMGILSVAGLVWIAIPDFEPLGPVAEGYEFYESVDIDEVAIDLKLLEGLEQPYYKFVMEPNIVAARAESRGWEEPELWDRRFYEYVTASVKVHGEAWAFWSRLEAIQVEYGKVVMALRQSSMPEVFAAIPYQESRYKADAKSEVCAQGYWQFMPEVAHRLATRQRMDFQVANCVFEGSNAATWSPTDLAPPPNVRRNGPYMDNGTCRITRCNTDDRRDLTLSTAAAMFTLGEAWRDAQFAQSGAAVQLVIASHNAGYEDGRFGKKYTKSTNVKPAYTAFLDKNGPEQGRQFMGQQIRCRTAAEGGRCGSAFVSETQHYAYSIVAQHTLAVCYYAQNYGETPAFKPWRFFVGTDGYCKNFKVPRRDEVRSRPIGGGK